MHSARRTHLQVLRAVLIRYILILLIRTYITYKSLPLFLEGSRIARTRKGMMGWEATRLVHHLANRSMALWFAVMFLR